MVITRIAHLAFYCVLIQLAIDTVSYRYIREMRSWGSTYSKTFGVHALMSLGEENGLAKSANVEEMCARCMTHVPFLCICFNRCFQYPCLKFRLYEYQIRFETRKNKNIQLRPR
jgi:hypothetical protein